MITDFTGYTISTGFQTLDLIPGGNESETDIPASGNAYEKALTDALTEAFPGADITVTQDKNSSGSRPFDLQTHVYQNNALPENEEEMIDEVDQIAQKTYENQDAWIIAL